LVGQTGELLAHNLFAYCKNSPVNMKDEDGFRPIFSNIYGQEEETELERYVSLAKTAGTFNPGGYERTGTEAYGFSVSVGAGARVGVTIQRVTDSHNNKGLLISPIIGGSAIPQASLNLAYTRTNADTIFDLSGPGGDAGGSASLWFIGVGTDWVYCKSNGKYIDGYSINIGGKFQPVVEVHADYTYTWILSRNKVKQ